MPRPRRWTDEQLAAAVAASRTLSEVHVRLGLRPGRYDAMRTHIARLGLAASHIPTTGPLAPPARRTWTDAQFVDVVAESRSIAAVCRALGYAPSGGTHRFVVRHIARLALNTSHFTGQAWNRGTRRTGQRSIPLSEILVANSTYQATGKLRQRLVREGLLPGRCQHCGLAEWRGEALPLHLDHINGDHADNRLENLRILCPNCHAQTDTWCGRNRRRRPTAEPHALDA